VRDLKMIEDARLEDARKERGKILRQENYGQEDWEKAQNARSRRRGNAREEGEKTMLGAERITDN
jgi:hypothetical protein